MFPLLVLGALVAGLVVASRSGAPAPRAIPAPANANLRALPAGSIVMVQGVSEAAVILKAHVIKAGDLAAVQSNQGGLLALAPNLDLSVFAKVGETFYLGHSVISATTTFFTSDEIVGVQFVSPASVFVDQPL
jgi:hypothetical protein